MIMTSTIYREQLDSMLVNQNCTPEEYEEVLVAYKTALVQEWEEQETFEYMYAGAGSLE